MAKTINAYVGQNGSGKTLAVIEEQVLPAWRRGRLVVGNLRLDPEALGFDASLYQPMIGTSMIPEMGTCQQPEGMRCAPGDCRPDGPTPHRPDHRGKVVPYSTTQGRSCLVVFDEISACFPSRSFSTLPPEVARKLNQLRKYDVTLAWTAPSWKRCDTILRECTQTVTLCKGLWSDRWRRRTDKPGRFPRALRDDEGGRLKVESDWLPHRVFLWRTFDAEQFEEFNTDKVNKEQLRPMRKRWYWRSRHEAHLAYDTLEGVDLLDHVDDYGVCLNCRGQRTRPKCTCTTGPRRSPQPSLAAAEGAVASAGHVPSPARFSRNGSPR